MKIRHLAELFQIYNQLDVKFISKVTNVFTICGSRKRCKSRYFTIHNRKCINGPDMTYYLW